MIIFVVRVCGETSLEFIDLTISFWLLQSMRWSGERARPSCKSTCSWWTTCAWWKVAARVTCVSVRRICVTAPWGCPGLRPSLGGRSRSYSLLACSLTHGSPPDILGRMYSSLAPVPIVTPNAHIATVAQASHSTYWKLNKWILYKQLINF